MHIELSAIQIKYLKSEITGSDSHGRRKRKQCLNSWIQCTDKFHTCTRKFVNENTTKLSQGKKKTQCCCHGNAASVTRTRLTLKRLLLTEYEYIEYTCGGGVGVGVEVHERNAEQREYMNEILGARVSEKNQCYRHGNAVLWEMRTLGVGVRLMNETLCTWEKKKRVYEWNARNKIWMK